MIVNVYTTTTCPYCKMAKEFLKAHNIKFNEINVQEQPEKGQEITEKSGEIGVPQIEIKKDKDDAGTIIVGFDKEEPKNSLGLS